MIAKLHDEVIPPIVLEESVEFDNIDVF